MADKNPYEDLVSSGGGGGGQPKQPKTPSLQDSQYDYAPEETQASTYALTEIFGKVPDYWALNAPDTISHITLPENQVYQAASIQALQYLQMIYGPQLTPVLQASLLQKPEQREYAYSVLQQIAARNEPSYYEVKANAAASGKVLPEKTVDAELMSRVIEDPGLLDTYGPETRRKVIEQARMAGEALAPAGDTAKQFFHITGQTASQNYDVFMNKDEKAALEQILRYAKTGTETPAGAGRVNPVAGLIKRAGESIGVAEVQNAGGPNPTIILDQEWARARPVRAAAVMDYLRTTLPDVSFRVGEKGLVGKVLDVLGKPVDVVSAPIGAIFNQIGEVSEELSDKIRYDDNDRARMAQEADSLQRQLEEGKVKPEDWDDALRTIQHLKDNAESEINYTFGEGIDLNLNPREAGFGFAENYTEGLDLLPGDPGYDAAYAISGLAANIIFDPLNYALPAVGGINAAKHMVAGAAELTGKFDVTLDAFRTMGKAEDATRVARASVAAVLPGAPKTVEEIVGKGRYVIFKASDIPEDIEKVLKSRFQVGKATLNGEDALLVPKVSLEEGIHIAHEAGLSHFLSTEGVVDVGRRTVREVEKVTDAGKGATDVASFGGRSWGYKIAKGETKLRPPRIAGGYTKNFFYQRLVKTPEEWIASKPGQEAVHKLWVRRATVGRERFLANVQRLFNVDARTARIFANARNEDDLAMGLHAAMTGNMAAPFNEQKLLGRLNAATDRLNEGDALRASGANPERLTELDATRADDAAEVAFLRSMSSGRDFDIAIRDLPNSRQWRSFMGKENRGPLGRALVSAAEFSERFPGNLLSNSSYAEVARHLQTPEGRIAEKSAKQMSIGLGRWFHPHGAGGRLHFPYVALPADELPDAVRESVDNLRNILRTFAVPNDKAEEIVGKFIDLKNERQGFEWTKEFWGSVADDSPLLASTGREQIRDIWPDLYSERSPGFVTTGKPGEFWKTEPTLFRTSVDEAGKFGQDAVPAFTADMLHSIKLPELDTVLELISFNRRMLRNWSKAGGLRQPIAKGVMEGQRMWEAFARFWKSSVLLFKMPAALPGRIVGEELVRIAAYDEASLVNHPIAWFKSMRGADEFAIAAESNAVQLGLLGEQFIGRMRKVRPGRKVVTLGHDAPDLYARAASVKIAKLAKSPEVSRWYLDRTPQEALAAMESGEGLARGSGDLLGLWDELIHPQGVKSRLDAVRRIKNELDQLANGNDKVRAAMKNGKMTDEAGDVVEAGTDEFTAELQRMLEEGEWQPQAKQIPTAAHEFEWVNPKTGLQSFRDWAFDMFYTKPDVAISRQPLYRSIATREYQRLKSLGWSEQKALESSHAYGARRVADLLYRIGETSSAHHFLRNIAPFFPAFQELTNTWLVRIPKAMGGGFWAPGAVRLARKADVFMDFFKQMGIVEKDARGEWTVPIPFLGRIMGALTGSPVPLRARASLSSFAGVLPDPFSGISGLLPGLGAPSSAILSEFAERVDDETVDKFAEYLMPFGPEVSLGPSAVDRLMMAAGIEPPWQFGSPDYLKSQKAYAIDDAVRMEMVRNPPPKKKAGESDGAFAKRYTRWSESVLQKAEGRASLMYAMRGISSMVLPFSAQYADDYETEMTNIWSTLSNLPGGGDEVTGPFINAFKAKYPEAVWYVNGTGINLKDDRDFSMTDSFISEWTQKKRDVFTPEEYLRWTVGMQSFSVYMNKLSRAYDSLGNTPADVLVHGFERFDKITPLKAEWEDYLEWTDSITPAGERSFHDLYKEWEKAREKQDGTNINKTQEDILELKQATAAVAGLFTENGVRNGTYKDFQRVLTEKLGELDLPSSTDIGKGISWWWKNVGDPYGESISEKYDKLSTTDNPFVKAKLYEEIRSIANSAKRVTYKGQKMPTPEEVFFGNLSPQEQELRRLDWATLPVEWLTNFQMEKIGLKTSPKLTQLASFINQDESRFDLLVAQNDLSPASNDYEALRRAFDLRAAEKARDLGLGSQFALMKAPVYKRIDHFFSDEFDSASWNAIVRMADQGTAAIESAPDGSITDTKEAVGLWLVQQVRRTRANDRKFDDIMSRLEVAYAPSGDERMSPDLLVLKLFTDYYGDSAPASLYA